MIVASSLRRKLCVTPWMMGGLRVTHAGEPRATVTVSVLHWWTSDGERRAANALVTQLAANGIRWQDMAIPGGGGTAAVKVLKSRVLMGDPPDAAQLIGTTLIDWADAGLVLKLDGVAAQQRWGQAIFPTVQKQITHRGATIATPLGIHRINNLYFNHALFERLALTPPTTWIEFEKIAQTLKAQGIQPLAWSDQAWQIATVFESVLLSHVGPTEYDALMTRQKPQGWASNGVTQALLRLRWLRSVSIDKPVEITWTQAARQLQQGQSAMMMMGDWMSGEMLAWGAKSGVDFGCTTVPGTAGVHLYSLDTLAMLKSARQRELTQEKMAEVFTSAPTQMAYNLAKGSVPVRNDINVSNLDACARDSWTTFANLHAYRVPSLAHRMAADEATKDAVAQILWRFTVMGMPISDTQTRLATVMRRPSGTT